MTFVLNTKGEPVPEPNIDVWAAWMVLSDQIGRRTVAQTSIRTFGGEVVTVHTVFLGMDHGFHRPQPLLWETVTFGPGQIICRRCSGSREQAEAMHSEIVNVVSKRHESKTQ